MKKLIEIVNEVSKSHVYSAGVILYRTRENTDDVEFFVCSPGGPLWKHRVSWNFPKGMIDGDEKPIDAAIREFEEETGTKLNNPKKLELEDIVKQSSAKSVYTYSKKWENEDLTNCHSNMFTWKDGKDYPEIGKYAWMTSEEIQKAGGVKAYYSIFDSITNKIKTK